MIRVLAIFPLWLLFALPSSAGPAADARYVGSAACTGCHAEAARLWSGSDHALAWTEPAPQTVRGDFDDAVYEHGGVRTKFWHRKGIYHLTITEADGTRRDYPVHSVAGIRPLQQYLIETEPGRLQAFDVAWDTRNRRWYALYPDQHARPGDGLHWTGPYKNWNGRCAECHATGFRKNYRIQTRRYESTQAEKGVGCEACHGPGSVHVERAQRKVRGEKITASTEPDFSMNFRVDAATAIQQCAGCHARREPLGDGNPLPGTPFHDAYRLSLLEPGLYHADGQIRDEVYVYGSFLQSKMYARGVSCMNCHDPHSGKTRAAGNALCTRCHSPAGNPDFPTLPRRNYDSPDHHFHPPGSAGAQCRNCHMLQRTYMGVDRRRDHSFRIPRPDLDGVTGAPDACTDCHTDKTTAWAAAEIARRYPAAAKRPHYGTVLARGRKGPAAAGADLIALALDDTQPGIVRASALRLLQRATGPDVAERIAPALEDPDPLVRAAAIGVQDGASPRSKVQRILPRLGDPARTVRIQAARHLLGAPILRLPEPHAGRLQAAMGEWQQSLNARADYPETHMAIGGAALVLRNAPAAIRAFREAVRLDPQLEQGWIMLARVTAATEGREPTRKVLAEAVKAMPQSRALQTLKQEIEQDNPSGDETGEKK